MQNILIKQLYSKEDAIDDQVRYAYVVQDGLGISNLPLVYINGVEKFIIELITSKNDNPITNLKYVAFFCVFCVDFRRRK